MIKDNQKYFNRLQVVLDGLMIILSYLLAWFLMLRSVEGKEIGVLPPEFYMMVLVVLVPFFLLLYYACNLYTPKRVQGRRLEGSNIVKANIIGGLTLMAAYFFLQLPNVSRLQIGLFLLLNVIFLFVERNVVRIILMRFRKSGLNLKHIILVGYSRAAEEYIDRIVQNPQWGYKVMGILDDRVVAGTEYRGIGVLGTIGSLSALLEVNHPDEIAITLGLSEYYKLERIVAMCEKAGVPCQMYTNRADMPGGATLGSIANTKVSVNTVDIGLAQLAMHSAFETAGDCDTEYMVKALKKFFSARIKCEGGEFEVSFG